MAQPIVRALPGSLELVCYQGLDMRLAPTCWPLFQLSRWRVSVVLCREGVPHQFRP